MKQERMLPNHSLQPTRLACTNPLIAGLPGGSVRSCQVAKADHASRQTKAKYRHTLPQLGGGLFLTAGGLETTLIPHEGWERPDYAAFHLLQTLEGEAALRRAKVDQEVLPVS